MRGIRLSHGVTFVEYEERTFRISANGKCEISPIMFSALERDLRTESPDKWEYISGGEVMSIVNGMKEQLSDEL